MTARTPETKVNLGSAPAQRRAKRAAGRRRRLTVKAGLQPGQNHLINGGESPPRFRFTLAVERRQRGRTFRGQAMASSPVNAADLTQEQLVKFLIEKIKWNVEIAPFWPTRGVVGGKLRYARTNQLSSADINAMATILADGANIVDQTPAVDENVTYTLGELSSRYKLDYNAQDRWRYQSIDNALSLLACLRCLLMSFRKLDLDNTSAEGDYDSLYDMCDAGQIVDMAGVAPTLAKLQETWHLVVAGTRPNLIMCNRRASRAIIKAFNDKNMHPTEIEMMFPDPITGKKSPRRVPAINGTPILINDLIATADGTDLTRIYMMVMGEDCEQGIHGVIGLVPKDLEGKLFIRRESAEPSAATTSLMNVTYTFPTATAMGCASALAILEDVLV